MARPGAIAHSRPHLSRRASFLSLSSFVSPLRPLSVCLLLRCDPRSGYGRRSGQPSSSSLARRACVHVFPVFVSGFAVVCSMALRVHVFMEYVDKVLTEVHDFIGYPMLVQVFIEFALWDTLKFACAPGLSGGRGEMAMAVASSARLAFFVVRSAPVVCRTPDAFPFWSLYSDGPLSSRPQPLGVSETSLPVKTQGGLWTVRLISVHHILLQGVFYFLCRRDPLA